MDMDDSGYIELAEFRQFIDTIEDVRIPISNLQLRNKCLQSLGVRSFIIFFLFYECGFA